MASDIWLVLNPNERDLVQKALAPLIIRGSAEASAMSDRLEDARTSSKAVYACILTTHGGKTVLTEQEYGIVQSALEWWIRELEEEAACACEDRFDQLQTEAELADRIWREME